MADIHDDECDHGMLLGTCSICKHRTGQEPTTYGRPFAANYAGLCKACGEPIEVDDIIVARDRHEGTDYIHDECIE